MTLSLYRARVRIAVYDRIDAHDHRDGAPDLAGHRRDGMTLHPSVHSRRAQHDRLYGQV